MFRDNRKEIQDIFKRSKADVVILDRWLFDADCYAQFRGQQRFYHDNEIHPNVQILIDSSIDEVVKRLGRRKVQTIYYNRESLERMRQIMLDTFREKKHATLHFMVPGDTVNSDRRMEMLTNIIEDSRNRVFKNNVIEVQ